MSVRLLLTHRCTVQRDGATGTDAHGHPNAPVWANHLTDQPCYLFDKTSAVTGERRDALKAVVLAAPQMIVPTAASITAADRITGVVDRRGGTIDARTFGVRQVVRRPTHTLLLLEAVG